MRKPIYERLREHVADVGLTITQIAGKTGWKYLRVMRLLNGTTKLSADDMEVFERVLKRPVGRLYRGLRG